MPQTVPVQGHYSESSWNGPSKGLQYSFADSTSQGHAEGFSENTFPFSMAQMDQSQPQSRWSGSPIQAESVEMARFPSQDSIGNYSHRTGSSSITDYEEQAGSVVFFHSPETSYHMSAAPSDRSASPIDALLFTPTQHMVPTSFNTFPFPDGAGYSASPSQRDDASIANPAVQLSLNTERRYDIFATSATGPYQSSLNADPNIWDTSFVESQQSSPTADFVLLPVTADFTPTSPQYDQGPPELKPLPYSVDDRTIRKSTVSRRAKIVRYSDSGDGDVETSAADAKIELEYEKNARDDPLYQGVPSEIDGLYHCPFEGRADCSHKPDKLKCVYE